MLSLGIGKTFNKQVDVDFTARASYLTADVDRFAESINGSNPGFGLALEIDMQKIKSLTSNIGVRVSKVISTNSGVLIPQANLSWLHEFEDDPNSLRVRFVNDPFSTNFVQGGVNSSGPNLATIFEIPLDDTDTNYAVGGVGFKLSFT